MKYWWGLVTVQIYTAFCVGAAHAQSTDGEITVTDDYGTYLITPRRTTIGAARWQQWFTLNEAEIASRAQAIIAAESHAPVPAISLNAGGGDGHHRRHRGLSLATESIVPTTLVPTPDLIVPVRPGGITDPFAGLLPIFSSIFSFIRDFIDRFRERNDNGFANLTNFRAEFSQSLGELEAGRGRVDLIVEAYRHYHISNISFNIEAAGAGVRVLYDPDPARMMTLGISALPAYGEIRNLLFGNTGSIGNDFLVRASASGLVSVRPAQGVEVGVVVSFQPQWIDFGHFRSLQEIYARLTMLPDRFGNDQYYVQELVFIPRLVHWVNTDPTIGLNPGLIGWASDEARALSQTAPELLTPPRNELIFMGSLGFRFSL